ncbi:MAG: RIP metalloprotease RseP [Leptospirillia bacterium]
MSGIEAIFSEQFIGAIRATAVFIPVLAILIFVHELGHFLVARWCGVRVLTFAIGFGPTMISRTYGDTEYALKWIPLGGYVKMYGEGENEEVDPDASDQGEAGAEAAPAPIPEEERHLTFAGKSVWQRMSIVFAGPLFNMLTAVLIFCGVYMVGVPVLTSDVGTVQEDSPAYRAGLVADDRITAIDGQPVTQWDDIRNAVQEAQGSSVMLTVEHAATEGISLPAEREVMITPEMMLTHNIFGEEVQRWLIGVSPKGTTFTERHNPVTATVLGLQKTWEVTSLTMQGIIKLIQRVIPSDTIGGPILIAQMASQQANEGFLNIALFVALLSVNLGILNLLPIPVLDGGHLVFLSAEALIGRPVSIRVREVAQQAGLFMLLALMAFAFYNDIMRFFTES